MELSIIIPCRNEEETIINTIEVIKYSLKKKKYIFEIILINDFSSDRTLKILKKIKAKNSFIKVLNNKKKGLGGAIETGINKSLGLYTVIVMSDLSDSVKDIINYYECIKKKNLDAVFGSRFIKGSKVIDYPKKKLFLNRVFNNLIKIIFCSKYNDFTNAFKIYKTKELKNTLPFISQSFNVFLEIPLKFIIKNCKYKIIPISWKNRKLGEAKFKIKELGLQYLFTLAYIFLLKIFKKIKN